MSRVTVLWTVGTPPLMLKAAPDVSFEVLSVGVHDLPTAVTPALALGGVVAVVADVGAAEQALDAGADEVCWGEADERSVRGAIVRAQVRASARSRREGLLGDLVQREGAGSLVSLATGIAQDMNNPLAAATLNFDVVRAMFGAFASVAHELALHAERGDSLPPQELAKLIAVLASVPGTDEIDSVMEDIEESLSRMAEVIARISALSAYDLDHELTDLSAVISETEAVVRPQVERVAVLLVDVPPEPCLVGMPRAWVVQIVAALVLNAIQAVVEAARKAPEIELRVVTTDDVALIEVRDTGVGMSGDVRRHAADPFYTTRRPGAVGLGLTMTAAYVRNVGGELFIESAAGGGTAIKVFVPRIKSAKVRASGSGGTPLN